MKQNKKITALLSEALSDEPSKDFSERVMNRLDLVRSVVEMGRLLGVAPIRWAVEDDPAQQDRELEEE